MILTIVLIYFVVLILMGYYISKRAKSASDFLVAGRKLGLLLTTATLAAVQLGAGVLMGGAELGAGSGFWPGMWYGLGCGGGLILAGIFVAAKLRKNKGFVPLDFFADRYGEKKWVRVWGWLSNIPSLLGIFVVQIMAAGSIFSVFGFDYKQGVILSAIVIMTYSVMGGMWGVVVNDLIHLGVIILGIPLVAVMTFIKLKSLGNIQVGAVFSTPFIPSGMLSKAIFLILPFLLAISISYDAYMRYQSAKSAKVAQWGCILGGIIVIFISFCAGFVGAAGRIIFPNVENVAVLPHVIKEILHPALAGIVVAALLAAAMSSANCLLISLSGCFSRDLYNKVFHPEANLDELKYAKLLSRVVIVVALIAGVLIAFYAKGILYTMIIFNYPYMGSMLIPLLGGVLWKRATAQGALSAIFVGGIIGVIAFIVGVFGNAANRTVVDLALLSAYLLSLLVFVQVSKLTSKGKLGNL